MGVVAILEKAVLVGLISLFMMASLCKLFPSKFPEEVGADMVRLNISCEENWIFFKTNIGLGIFNFSCQSSHKSISYDDDVSWKLRTCSHSLDIASKIPLLYKMGLIGV